MTRAEVRRWTASDHPAPWEYHVPRLTGTVRGHRPSWQLAFARVQQIIADQTRHPHTEEN